MIPTLDALLFEFSDIFIIGEVSIPISFAFFCVSQMVKPNVAISHPHALAQCKHFLAENELTQQTADSTADACRIVAEKNDPYLGAIASLSAGAKFGLQLYADQIEDFQGARTRFLAISNRFIPPTTLSKSMLAILPPSSSVGVLSKFTSAFAMRGINIFSIHSRPTKRGIGQYVFIITAEGSITDGNTRNAIEMLLADGYRLKVLGSYPLSDSKHPVAPFASMPGFLNREHFHDFLLTISSPLRIATEELSA